MENLTGRDTRSMANRGNPRHNATGRPTKVVPIDTRCLLSCQLDPISVIGVTRGMGGVIDRVGPIEHGGSWHKEGRYPPLRSYPGQVPASYE